MKNEFDKIQKDLSLKIQLSNIFHEEDIKYVAGVDLAYWVKEEDEMAVCCIAVIDYKTGEVIEDVFSSGKVEVPYMPGYLAFRELPLVIKAAEKLKHDPDVYMFDGNGYLHPRHMGIATHASFFLKKPTLGGAKSYYKIDNEDFIAPENNEGAYSDIVINGEVYGRALRTHKNVKPIFISAGNYIDLNTSMKIVNKLIKKDSHIPIPTRKADILTHLRRKECQSMDI